MCVGYVYFQRDKQIFERYVRFEWFKAIIKSESRKSATSSRGGVARLTPEDVNFHDRTVFLLPLPPSLLSTATVIL